MRCPPLPPSPLCATPVQSSRSSQGSCGPHTSVQETAAQRLSSGARVMPGRALALPPSRRLPDVCAPPGPVRATPWSRRLLWAGGLAARGRLRWSSSFPLLQQRLGPAGHRLLWLAPVLTGHWGRRWLCAEGPEGALRRPLRRRECFHHSLGLTCF